MGGLLRPARLHRNARAEARAARRRGLLSRLRPAAGARRGLRPRAAAAARAGPRRERYPPAQPRSRSAGARMPRPVSLGLQPLQDAARRQAKARVSRIAFAFMWLARFLPLGTLAAVGNIVGAVMFWLIPERRNVTRINLEKCFPQKSADEREALARAHFRAFCRAFVEQGILWWAPRERIQALVRLDGIEHLQGHAKTIVFAPHFIGFEATLVRLTLDYPLAMMYSRQKDPSFEARLLAGRMRFGGVMIPRQAGVKEGIELIDAGRLYYYLPDLDFGPKRSVFVP